MSEPILLPPKLDLAAASDLKTILAQQTEEEVVLDMSEVKNLGTLCLQVLLSAASSANSEQRTISFTNASDRVLDQLRIMGMTPEAISRGRQ